MLAPLQLEKLFIIGGMNIVVERDVVSDYEITPPGYVAKLTSREAFAGSVALMIDVLKNLVELAFIPLLDAVKMLTTTPSRIMRIDSERGSLVPGNFADITVFTEKFEVLMTMVEGIVVYKTF